MRRRSIFDYLFIECVFLYFFIFFSWQNKQQQNKPENCGIIIYHEDGAVSFISEHGQLARHCGIVLVKSKHFSADASILSPVVFQLRHKRCFCLTSQRRHVLCNCSLDQENKRTWQRAASINRPSGRLYGTTIYVRQEERSTHSLLHWLLWMVDLDRHWYDSISDNHFI